MIDSQQTRPSKKATRGNRSVRRLIGFRLAAILLALLPFVVVEGLLVLLGIGRPTENADASVAFTRIVDLFDRDDDDGVYHTARSRQFNFGDESFPIDKNAEEYRIFCLGGSTVRGRPFDIQTAFPAWLELELSATDPQRTYRVVNCGGVSYASYRLAVVLDEVLENSPDLIILATGHNEFLEDRTYQDIKARGPIQTWLADRANTLRTVQLAKGWLRSDTNDQAVLPQDVKARLDETTGYASYERDDEWREQVITQYDQTVRAMVAACGRKKVPIVLVNLGENLRDCPPFKSQHRPGLSADDEQQWQTLFDRATAAEENNLSEALAIYRSAENLDGEHALLCFRIARCLDRLGGHEEAHDYFVKAKRWDVCPLRMPEPMHEALTKIAADTNTPLVDVGGYLRERSLAGLPGHDWYVDHVHPSIAGHQQIAQFLTAQLRDQQIVTPGQTWDGRNRREAYQNHFKQLGTTYLSNGQRRIQWLERWARREQLHEETVPRDARALLHLGHRWLDLHEDAKALVAYQAAITSEPASVLAIEQHAVNQLRCGRPEAASTIVRWLREQEINASDRARLDIAKIVISIERGDLVNDELKSTLVRANNATKKNPWLELLAE